MPEPIAITALSWPTVVEGTGTAIELREHAAEALSIAAALASKPDATASDLSAALAASHQYEDFASKALQLERAIDRETLSTIEQQLERLKAGRPGKLLVAHGHDLQEARARVFFSLDQLGRCLALLERRDLTPVQLQAANALLAQQSVHFNAFASLFKGRLARAHQLFDRYERQQH